MNRVEGWKHSFTDDRRAPRFEGLGIHEAQEAATADGVDQVRVIDLDGKTLITFDDWPGRLNLLIEDGVVMLAGWFLTVRLAAAEPGAPRHGSNHCRLRRSTPINEVIEVRSTS